MENRKHNCAVKVTYGFIHFLGSVTRHISNGFYTIAPFMKPKDILSENNETEKQAPTAPIQPTRLFKTKEETLTQEPKPITVRENISQETKQSIASPVQKIIVPEETKPKPLAATALIKGIPFEDEDEKLRAEIYMNDFTSDTSNANIRNDSLEQIKRLSKPTAVEILKNLLTRENDQLKIMELLNTLTSLNNHADIKKELFTNYVDHDNPSIRISALRGISKYNDEECFTILSSALTDRDADIRKQALNLLCWSFDAKATSLYVKALHDVDNQVAKTAILICGALNIKQSISSLITLLSDPDREIQKSAVESLRKITKQKFGFNPTGSETNKKEAIECWRFWWRDNQSTFGMQIKNETEV